MLTSYPRFFSSSVTAPLTAVLLIELGATTAPSGNSKLVRWPAHPANSQYRYRVVRFGPMTVRPTFIDPPQIGQSFHFFMPCKLRIDRVLRCWIAGRRSSHPAPPALRWASLGRPLCGLKFGKPRNKNAPSSRSVRRLMMTAPRQGDPDPTPSDRSPRPDLSALGDWSVSAHSPRSASPLGDGSPLRGSALLEVQGNGRRVADTWLHRANQVRVPHCCRASN
jgi:hypothetical protein